MELDSRRRWLAEPQIRHRHRDGPGSTGSAVSPPPGHRGDGPHSIHVCSAREARSKGANRAGQNVPRGMTAWERAALRNRAAMTRLRMGTPVTAPQDAPGRGSKPAPPTPGESVLKPARHRAWVPPVWGSPAVNGGEDVTPDRRLKELMGEHRPSVVCLVDDEHDTLVRLFGPLVDDVERHLRHEIGLGAATRLLLIEVEVELGRSIDEPI